MRRLVAGLIASAVLTCGALAAEGQDGKPKPKKPDMYETCIKICHDEFSGCNDTPGKKKTCAVIEMDCENSCVKHSHQK
jgi:hypothetical protein